MQDPASFKIPDIDTGYRKVAKKLFTTFWVLAATFGTAIALGLGLARNDWIILTSDVSADTQDTGGWVALGAAYGAAAILGIYGLVAVFGNRLWFLFPFLALAGAFPALLYAPHWVPFAFSGGAITLGIVAFKIADIKDDRVAKRAASAKA